MLRVFFVIPYVCYFCPLPLSISLVISRQSPEGDETGALERVFAPDTRQSPPPLQTEVSLLALHTETYRVLAKLLLLRSEVMPEPHYQTQ